MKYKLFLKVIFGAQLLAYLAWIYFYYVAGENHVDRDIKKYDVQHQYGNHLPKLNGPPMGWNSWNNFHCDGLTEALVHDVVDVLINSGLAQAGYLYVNLDDCWQIDRNATGHLVADLRRFPSGMKALATYIHQRGLKFGLYTDQGTATCERRPGAYKHEFQDALTYANWGVDFIKNDDCYIHPSGDIFNNYKNFWDGIKRSGRKIIHSIKGSIPIEKAVFVSNMRRVGTDIEDEWGMMLSLVDVFIKNKLWKYSNPGFWNDLDMLEIGNGGMTQNEYITHMALWCIFKAPLLLGHDLKRMDEFTSRLLTHKEFIAIQQDSLGKSAELVFSDVAPSGSSPYRVVSDKCNSKDPSHQWIISRDDLMVKNKLTNMCLSADLNGTILVENCDSKKGNQKWSLESASNQLFSKSYPEKCIVTRWSVGVDASLRPCTDRANMKQNNELPQWWNLFSDSYIIQKIENIGNSELFTISSKDKTFCFKTGAPPDLMVFTGKLSNNKHVALLLNRDFKPHMMTLNFDLLAGKNKSLAYKIRDVWQMKNIGKYKNSFSTSVPGRYGLTLVLS